jgi:hypothetical protein
VRFLPSLSPHHVRISLTKASHNSAPPALLAIKIFINSKAINSTRAIYTQIQNFYFLFLFVFFKTLLTTFLYKYRVNHLFCSIVFLLLLFVLSNHAHTYFLLNNHVYLTIHLDRIAYFFIIMIIILAGISNLVVLLRAETTNNET